MSKKFHTTIDDLDAAQSSGKKKLAFYLIAAVAFILMCLLPQITYMASATALSLNQPALAVKLYGLALILKPRDYDILMGRAMAQVALGKLERAIADDTAAINIKPGSFEGYYRRGQAEQKKKDFNAALADFDKAIQLQPTMASAFVSRGALYSFLGEFDRALEDYNKAILLEPDNEEAVSEVCWIRDRKNDQSLATMEDLYSLYDNNRTPGGGAQTAKIDAPGKPSESRNEQKTAGQAASPVPAQIKEHYARFLELRKAKQYQQAIAELNLVLADPKAKAGYPLLLKQRAATFEMSGDLNRAVADYSRVLEVKPDAKTLTARGHVYLEQNDLDKARMDFDQAVRLDPGSRSALTFSNSVNKRLGLAIAAANPPAENHLTVALGSNSTATGRAVSPKGSSPAPIVASAQTKLSGESSSAGAKPLAVPDSSGPQHNGGNQSAQAHKDSNEKTAVPAHRQPRTGSEQARHLTQEQKNLHAEHPLTSIYRGHGIVNEETLQEAPPEVREPYMRAEMQTKQGKNAEAIESLREVLKNGWSKPYASFLYGKIGKLDEANNDLPAAAEALTKAIEMCDRPHSKIYAHNFGERGHCYLLMGKLDLALSDLNSALSQAPDNPKFLKLRIRTLIDLGRSSEARQDLQRLRDLRQSKQAVEDLSGNRTEGQMSDQSGSRDEEPKQDQSSPGANAAKD